MISFPNINPTILHIYGGMAIRWYNLSYMIGIFTIAYFFHRNFKNKKIAIPAYEIILSISIYAIIFARVGFVLMYDYAKFFSDFLILFKLWEGGMSFFGGLIGVAIGTYVNAKRHKIGFFNILDTGLIMVPFAIFLGRISNFINSELYGIPSNVKWCVIFPNDPTQLCRHPSQLYEAFFEGIILFIIGLYMYKKSFHIKKPSLITVTITIMYCVFRFCIEFFRNEDIGYGIKMQHLTQGQLLSLLVASFTFIVYILYNNKNEKS